jgi:hypothetical protein
MVDQVVVLVLEMAQQDREIFQIHLLHLKEIMVVLVRTVVAEEEQEVLVVTALVAQDMHLH